MSRKWFGAPGGKTRTPNQRINSPIRPTSPTRGNAQKWTLTRAYVCQCLSSFRVDSRSVVAQLWPRHSARRERSSVAPTGVERGHCRVKAYRVVSGTPAAPRRTAENHCPAWVFSVHRCASVCGVSHPFADHARTRRGPSSRKRRTAQLSSHPKRDGRRGPRTWLHPRPRKVGP